MKRLLIFGVLFVFGVNVVAQNNGAINVSVGSGYSLFLSGMKGGLNIALKQLDLPKVSSSPMIVASADVGLGENFNLGLGYTQNNFHWSDRFVKALPDSTLLIYDTVKVDARVDLVRRNFGIKGMYSFHLSEKFSMYVGLRVGASIWKTTIEGDYEFGETKFSFPASMYTVQVYYGGRWYFADPVGLTYEIGIGNAPYLASMGICARFNAK